MSNRAQHCFHRDEEEFKSSMAEMLHLRPSPGHQGGKASQMQDT